MKIGSLLVYRIAVTAFDIYFRRHGGIKAIDPHHVPATGGVIIAPIHLTDKDPPALACTMRHRRLLAMAKEELFKKKIYGWVIRQIGAFPIKRGEGDTDAIRLAISVLEAGEALLVFPEGSRGDGTRLLPMQRGPAMLAKKTGVPIVPVGIVGSRPKRKGVVVAYGKPFTYAEIAVGSNEKENREMFAKHLEAQIVELCNAHGLPVKSASSS